MDIKNIGFSPELRSEMELRDKAMSGDIVLIVTPATLTSSAATVMAAVNGAAAKFTRTVLVQLKTAAGELHSWFNGTLAVAVAESTAGNGVAAIAASASTVTLVNGIGSVVIEYTGAWAGGVAQVETATPVVDGAGDVITTAGNASVIVTSAGMTGSPKTISVALAQGDNVGAVATKIRAALSADSAVSGKFTVAGTGSDVVLTAKVAAANDGTLNVNINDDTSVGLAAAASSANTTAGVAKDTQTTTVTGGTQLGYTVANKTSVDTLIA